MTPFADFHTNSVSKKIQHKQLTSDAAELELDTESSDLEGMVLAYLGCLARISSKEMSSEG